MLCIVIIELIQDASPIGDETSGPMATTWVDKELVIRLASKHECLH